MRPVSSKYLKKDWKRNRNSNRMAAIYGDDWYSHYAGISFYPKKACRIAGNRAVRRYKGDIANGCAYKKVYDVQWEVW